MYSDTDSTFASGPTCIKPHASIAVLKPTQETSCRGLMPVFQSNILQPRHAEMRE